MELNNWDSDYGSTLGCLLNLLYVVMSLWHLSGNPFKKRNHNKIKNIPLLLQTVVFNAEVMML